MNYYQQPTAKQLDKQWRTLPRWVGIRRDYAGDDVVRLRGSVHVEYSLSAAGPSACGASWRRSRTSTPWGR